MSQWESDSLSVNFCSAAKWSTKIFWRSSCWPHQPKSFSSQKSCCVQQPLRPTSLKDRCRFFFERFSLYIFFYSICMRSSIHVKKNITWFLKGYNLLPVCEKDSTVITSNETISSFATYYPSLWACKHWLCQYFEITFTNLSTWFNTADEFTVYLLFSD